MITETKTLWVLVLLSIGSIVLMADDSAETVGFTLPEESPAEANEGHLLLEWNVDSETRNLVYQLDQAEAEDFSDARTVYRGPDEGSYISGLPAGSTYFRVRIIEGENSFGPWSNTMEVQVQFPESWKVLLLMACGSIMFILLVITIIRGRKRTRGEEANS